MSVFRASSLAAVTTFVWSTSDSPRSSASFRTYWRTATTSSEARIASRWGLAWAAMSPVLVRLPQQIHSALDIQSRAHAAQGQSQFDQRDRDRRLHPGHHRVGAEHLRHPRDISEHAPDERVHHLERGDIDQHPARPRRRNPLRQVFLKLERKPVVHVHLNGHQEELAHFQNRYSFHAATLWRSSDRSAAAP